MKLLLASRSGTRRAMLEAAGVPFEVASAEFDEEAAKVRLAGLKAMELAEALAVLKAKAATASGESMVLGADQTLELEDGTILAKPASVDDARGQLLRMSGRAHRLHAAAAVVQHEDIIWRGTETVTLTVRPLTTAFVDHYLEQEYQAIRWNVGGYRIEGPGAQLFERIEGSHFAILGLPLLPLLGFLRQAELLAS